MWYAQAHPCEDFAETFAVWLARPPHRWRREYAGWPALDKLEYVDATMNALRGRPAPVRCRLQPYPLSEIRRTLRRHYARRRAQKARHQPLDYADDVLRNLFDLAPPGSGSGCRADVVLQRLLPRVRRHPAFQDRQLRYAADQVAHEWIVRARARGLTLARPAPEAIMADVVAAAILDVLGRLGDRFHRVAV
jgi:hypothetical protein